MSITIALLTMEATISAGRRIMLSGWDMPTNALTRYGNELDKQTKDWQDEDFIVDGLFDSWAQMIETLAKQLASQICDDSVPEAEQGISEFLKHYYPHKFLTKYVYTIPTSSSLYGGFDSGCVAAMNDAHAIELVKNVVVEGFTKINKLLKENGLPEFHYSLDEVNIEKETEYYDYTNMA
jgi:hypothetical protein